MRKILLYLIITLSVTTSKLFAQETIIMRCLFTGAGKIELYLPGGKYEKVELPKWIYNQEQEIQLAISKKIEELNKQGFTVVSFNEAVLQGAMISTYILTKE